MQNLHVLEFLAEAFRYHVHHFQYLAVPVRFPDHGGWDSRDVSVATVCDCFKECMYFEPENELHRSEFHRDRKSIENGAHGIEKLLLKIQVSEDFA